MQSQDPTALPRLLSNWRSEPTIGGNIIQWQVQEQLPGKFADLPADLHPSLAGTLRTRGIQQLYSHQAASWEAVRRGENIVVVTGTASGKTLCYNLPVVDTRIKDTNANALYLFPTKALTQDQKDSLEKLTIPLQGFTIPVAVYDGDTPSGQRNKIRSAGGLILTNPDMLHLGILPHHTLWSPFLAHLSYGVIDEMHIYRGIFGSHVANVIRRLKRIAHFYGANPQFVLTSATIANPVQLAEKLIEEPVHLIADDGAPHGKRYFLLYNPPIIHPELGLRKSAASESLRLAEDLLAYRIQTILFARARRSVEIILKTLQERTAGADIQLHGYRSGYLPQERRKIEQSLRDGSAQAVVATNALELGVDIGNLGAAVLVGYPGTIAATRQQAGRAGRRLGSSLAVMVASSGPLDQFLMQHPDYLLDKAPEQAFINPDNLLILLHHLRCAAFELPFSRGERFGNLPLNTVEELLRFLEEAGIIVERSGRYFWLADQYPSNEVSLRSTEGQPVLLQTNDQEHWTTIGEVDPASARWMVHPQAIYLHEGQTFEVEDLSLENHRAFLRAANVDYYTEPRSQVDLEKIHQSKQNETPTGTLNLGEILVRTQVIGYRKIRWLTQENLGDYPLDMPPTELRTTAYWFTLADQTVELLRQTGQWKNDPNAYGKNWPQLRNYIRQRDQYTCQICGQVEGDQPFHVHHKVPFRNFLSANEANQPGNLITLCPACHQHAEAVIRMRSGLSGLGYTLHHLAPLFLMCDITDLGAQSDPVSRLSDGKPTIVIYDQVTAGIGLSDALYDQHTLLIHSAYDLVHNCPCLDGCPGCVGPAGENGVGGKIETLAILEILCNNQGQGLLENGIALG
ncbi:MAG: DEAD/DEAH box helicase [Anaerolineaceae bacterium]|nr:DEAD/DEAH box helicase [Anaerolineaceae bacterium]